MQNSLQANDKLIVSNFELIFDNIIYSLQKAGGISAYWSELSFHLINKVESFNFYGCPNENIFAKNIVVNVNKESGISCKILRYLYFRKKLSKGSVFHSSYYRVTNQKNVVNITTVHDFTYEYYRKGLARFVHSWQKSRAINKSDGIICISQNTKKDLLKFYPHINEDKISVIYNGVSSDYFNLDEPSAYLTHELSQLKNKKYIVYVGDRSSYKNFRIAIEVVNKLKDYHLVIVGGGELSKSEIESLSVEYYHFKNVASSALNVIYNNAFCLLYPSSYEGFGIPLVEAMQAGCPVVSTNISSIPEVVGNAALLVDKVESTSFVTEIIKLADPKCRKLMVLRGLEQATNFSWEKCASETLNFYKKISDKNFK